MLAYQFFDRVIRELVGRGKGMGVGGLGWMEDASWLVVRWSGVDQIGFDSDSASRISAFLPLTQ